MNQIRMADNNGLKIKATRLHNIDCPLIAHSLGNLSVIGHRFNPIIKFVRKYLQKKMRFNVHETVIGQQH